MLAPRDTHLDRAWNIAYQLVHGRLTLEDIAKQAADSAQPALQARVDGVLRQLTTVKDEDNDARLKALIEGLAYAGGRPIGFAQFKRQVEAEIAGIVFTAHPTFSLSPEATETALGLLRSSGTSLRGNGPASSGARSLRVRRTEPPTLQEELDASTAAILPLRRALRRMLRIVVDVAAQRYPEEYLELKPRLFTVATWVGFDLDGRTDISWSRSLSCRYQLALTGLADLRASVLDLNELHGTVTPAVAEALATIAQSLDALGECFAIGLDALGKEAEDSTRLGRLNRLALEKRALKQDAIGAIDDALATALASEPSATLAKDLLVLRSEWESMGLGLARLHFRLNSVQLHNAIRPEIKLHAAPSSSQSRRTFLAEITRLLDGVTPVNVHYGTVAREQTTAKRVFMLAAQFQKHFDGRTPVRLLIAESDTPFTLLVALYYARLFGVEQHLEISPLFETADGLHHGDRVISELLDNAHFAAYIRAHGRFCVQLGFSDSGRYIGQPAASLAIERFKLRLIRLWQERDLSDVQLLFFDTHGESIGRGAHPRSLADRFLYTHSREVRKRLADLAAPHKHEVSFQGGEGYLWFASQRTAYAVLTDLLGARLEPIEAGADALYANSAWGLDFFLTLKDYQERLGREPGYLALINTLGRNLLYPTGSRPVQRQATGGGRAGKGIEHIGDMRAIPNNAIVQQLAYLVNSFAGLGAAMNQAPDTFLAVLEHSDRLERIVSLALAARERSDVTVFEAYMQLMNANYWLDRSNQSLDRDGNRVLRRLSSVLEEAFDYEIVARFARMLRRDAAEIDDVLEQRHGAGSWSSADALTRLHTLRLALIHLIYLKAMEIPEFSARLEVSLAALIERLLKLDVPETVETLRRIFPAIAPSDDVEIYAERDTYVQAAPSGYAAEHAQIFEPIERAYALILELGALIALHVGAYG
jgi:phosphoenolpyruvate carboxylase